MDKCFEWIEEASSEVDELLSNWNDVSYYEAVFEDGSEKEAKNEKVTDKAIKIIHNIIDGIRKIIDKIKEGIETMCSWIKSSGSEKTKYEKFVEECKNNPEFANKKINYKDYSEANKLYESTLKAAEKEYRNLKEEYIENKPNLLKKVQGDLETGIKDSMAKAAAIGKASGKELGASFTIQAILEKCKNSNIEAIKVKHFLDNDVVLLDILEKELGKKEVKKFKMKVNFLNFKAKYLSKIIQGRQHQAMTLSESMKAAIVGIDGVYAKSKNEDDEKESKLSKLKSVVTTSSNVKKIVDRTDSSKATNKLIRDTVLDVNRYRKDAIDSAKERRNYAKTLNDADLRRREQDIRRKNRQETIDDIKGIPNDIKNLPGKISNKIKDTKTKSSMKKVAGRKADQIIYDRPSSRDHRALEKAKAAQKGKYKPTAEDLKPIKLDPKKIDPRLESADDLDELLNMIDYEESSNDEISSLLDLM